MRNIPTIGYSNGYKIQHSLCILNLICLTDCCCEKNFFVFEYVVSHMTTREFNDVVVVYVNNHMTTR